jgi:hypothetical protein
VTAELVTQQQPCCRQFGLVDHAEVLEVAVLLDCENLVAQVAQHRLTPELL